MNRNIIKLLLPLFILVAGLIGLMQQTVGAQSSRAVDLACTKCITYQGKLQDNNSNANGTYDFAFHLFDSLVGGVPLGSAVRTLTVADGLFSTTLDFGNGIDFGASYPQYLGIYVRPAGSSNPYTTLSPRTQLTAVPIALSLTADATIVSGNSEVTLQSSSYGSGVFVKNTDLYGVYVFGASEQGVYVKNAGDNGVWVSGTGDDGVRVDGAGQSAFNGLTNNITPTVKAVNTATSGDSEAGYFEVRSFLGEAIEAVNTYPHESAIIMKACSTANCTVREMVVRRDGNVTANGAFTGGGADYADMMEVAGEEADYEPGDVLVIDLNGQIAKSATPNSTSVVGVYSTDPAFIGDPLGNIDSIDGVSLESEQATRENLHARLAEMEATDNRIPVGLVGILPTKVSDENGAIQPGDLLTTSSLSGHAMKAIPVEIGGIEIYAPGTIIGKALGSLESGTGVINIVVTLQ